MILVLIEWLERLLSASWNQRDTKEKQIVMGLASIKFRQPTEISYGKNERKGKGREDYSIRISVNKQKMQINQKHSF